MSASLLTGNCISPQVKLLSKAVEGHRISKTLSRVPAVIVWRETSWALIAEP